jgi:hypothetical protein
MSAAEFESWNFSIMFAAVIIQHAKDTFKKYSSKLIGWPCSLLAFYMLRPIYMVFETLGERHFSPCLYSTVKQLFYDFSTTETLRFRGEYTREGGFCK